MKRLAIITAVMLTTFSSVAYADGTDTLLGAAAGAAIGSTIGNGDGKKIATVIGGLIGAEMARDAAEAREHEYTPVHGSGFRHNQYFVEQRIRRDCERRIPAQYWGMPRAEEAWVRGCVRREMQIRAEMEAQAYRDGYRDQY
jgi:hypothetical protein